MASRLGDRLAALMDEKGVTTAQLAEAGGIDESTMQSILRGDIQRSPDQRLQGFAELLGVSFDSLLNLIPEDRRETAQAAAFDLAACAVSLGGTAPDWIQLLPLGQVNTRSVDGRGPWVVSDAAAIIEASRAVLDKLPIDYDHQTDHTRESGNAAPAAGWMAELQVRPDGIYARVEWTERGRAAIAAREYRFISPVFNFDKATGRITRILRAGLTNDPALPMKALANREPNSNEEPMEELLQKLRKILGLADDADEAAVCAALQAVADQAKGESVIGPIAQALGLKAEASADEVATAAAKVTAAAAKAGDRDELAETVAKITKERATEKATAAVDEAVTSGKLIPAQRDWAMAQATADLASFEKFLEGQPVIVAPSGGGGGGGRPPVGNDGVTSDERAVCKALGLDVDDYKKTRESNRANERENVQ